LDCENATWPPSGSATPVRQPDGRARARRTPAPHRRACSVASSMCGTSTCR